MIQTQPAKGREVSIGRSMLPALHLYYFLTNPDTGQLEHHCKTPSGERFVTVIDRERLRALLTQLNDHVFTLLDARKGA